MRLAWRKLVCVWVAKGVEFRLQDLYGLKEGFVVSIPGNFVFSDGSFELLVMKRGRHSS